jgi:hypothetical protein
VIPDVTICTAALPYDTGEEPEVELAMAYLAL